MNGEDHALELRAVCAAYGTIDVLRGVDLAVPYDSVVALLGPNGGGKSTTMRVIAGQLTPTSGDLFIAGRRVNGARSDDLPRRGVCLIPEGRGIFPNLSVRENLWMATYTGATDRQIEEVAFARFPRLADKRHQLAGTLSGGEQQMLALARALSTNPASRCGRRPTVVRMTRSHEAFTGGSVSGGRRGVRLGAVLGPQALAPKPIAAMVPVVRNARLCMSASHRDNLIGARTRRPRRTGETEKTAAAHTHPH